MVFLKAQLSGRMDDVEFLLKCLIEQIENDIRKAIGDEPLDEDLVSGKKRIKRSKSVFYTDEDKNKDRIPKGKKVGDRKEPIDGNLSPRAKSKIERRLKRPMSAKERKYRESLDDSGIQTSSIRDFAAAPKLKRKKKPVSSSKDIEIPITGEKVFEAYSPRPKKDLEKLKTLLDNKETKKYLNRLKQVVTRFPVEGKPNKRSREYKDNLRSFLDKKGAGVEVFSYLLTALTNLKDSTEDGTKKKSIQRVIDTLKRQNQNLLDTLKIKRAKQTDFTSDVEQGTQSFYKRLSKAFQGLDVKLIEASKKSEEAVLLEIRKVLGVNGNRLTMLILKEMNTKRDADEITPQKLNLPDDIFYQKGLDEPRKKEKKTSTRQLTEEYEAKKKLKKAFISTYRLLDITKYKPYKLKIRTIPYSDNAKGIKLIENQINEITKMLSSKRFKQALGKDMLDYINDYASITDDRLARVDSGTKEEKKKKKEEIQNYMNIRLKRILEKQKTNKRVPNVPKALVRSYDKLTDEIIKDLRKFSVFAKYEKVSESPVTFFVDTDGEKTINMSIIFDDFKKALDSSKEEKKRLDEQKLKEYTENEKVLEDVTAKLQKFADEEMDGIMKDISSIQTFVEYMNKTEKKYTSAINKLKTIDPSNFDEEDENLFETISKTMKIRIKIEGDVYNALKNFGAFLGSVKEEYKGRDFIKIIDSFEEELDSFPEEIENTKRIFGLYNDYVDRVSSVLERIFSNYRNADISALEEITFEFNELSRKQRRLIKIGEDIKKNVKVVNDEEKEKELLLQFYEMKQNKLKSGKDKEPPTIVEKLIQSFRENPVQDKDGKLVTSEAEIARYLDEKYKNLTDLDRKELQGYIEESDDKEEEE